MRMSPARCWATEGEHVGVVEVGGDVRPRRRAGIEGGGGNAGGWGGVDGRWGVRCRRRGWRRGEGGAADLFIFGDRFRTWTCGFAAEVDHVCAGVGGEASGIEGGGEGVVEAAVVEAIGRGVEDGEGRGGRRDRGRCGETCQDVEAGRGGRGICGEEGTRGWYGLM